MSRSTVIFPLAFWTYYFLLSSGIYFYRSCLLSIKLFHCKNNISFWFVWRFCFLCLCQTTGSMQCFCFCFSKVLLGTHYGSLIWLFKKNSQSFQVSSLSHSILSFKSPGIFCSGPFRLTHPIASFISYSSFLCAIFRVLFLALITVLFLGFNLLFYLSTECLCLMNYIYI